MIAKLATRLVRTAQVQLMSDHLSLDTLLDKVPPWAIMAANPALLMNSAMDSVLSTLESARRQVGDALRFGTSEAVVLGSSAWSGLCPAKLLLPMRVD